MSKAALLVQAASIGNRASIPLGVAKADLHLNGTLHSGQQGSVLQGTFKSGGVAVKKARISTAQVCVIFPAPNNVLRQCFLLAKGGGWSSGQTQETDLSPIHRIWTILGRRSPS